MSAGIEQYEVGRWIHDTLAAGTALCALIGGTVSPRIYPDFAPQGLDGTADFVAFAIDSANDELVVTGTAGAILVMATVKGVVQSTSYCRAAAIMKYAHPLISAMKGTVYDGTVPALYVLGCERTGGVAYPENYGGNRYMHMGAEYRVWVQNA